MTLRVSRRDLMAVIEAKMQDLGFATAIHKTGTVGGGDINHGFWAATDGGRVFVKWNPSVPVGFFEAEAAGLQHLAKTGVVRVPQVIGMGRVAGTESAYLILEYIEPGRKDAASAAQLGEQLAELHRQTHVFYGLEAPNMIGRLTQRNTPDLSWLTFYQSQRLSAQRDLALRQGFLSTERGRRLDWLIDNLYIWLHDDEVRPALLHGDLWGGNWLTDESNQPVLIDPAVYYGHREVDLAMTRLFGGFPSSFYEAYNTVHPLDPDYTDRQPIYQLYYLLCHLNLFGESYGRSVDALLKRFTP
ncbi:MAG: fructosamine kinase family protein [Chloroflexi bacterium]|nr:fructosamine kinase family protein [Chloroflexota bacterium]